MQNKKSPSGVVAVVIAILFVLGINAVFISIFAKSFKTGNTDLSMLIPLIAVDAVIISSVVTAARTAKKKKILAEKGREYTAKFVSYTHRTTNDGPAKYSIQYTWTDNQGVVRNDKSGYTYTAKQAVAFQLIKTFKIKASEDYSEIISNPEILVEKQSNGEKIEELIECAYCGSVYNSNKTKCPYCGATRSKM